MKYYPSKGSLGNKEGTASLPKAELIQKSFVLRSEFENYISNITNTSVMETEEEEPITCLKWWEMRRILYPNMFKFVTDVFSAQATSTQSERLFSKAGIFIGKDRASMSKQTLRKSFCVSEWLKTVLKK